jgi:hypothetical protein
VLFEAAARIRESRGDGHVASLVAAGIDGCESHLTLAGDTEKVRRVLQPRRGWTDAEWEAAVRRLRDRGLLDDDGALTAAGADVRAGIERRTDALAVPPVAGVRGGAPSSCSRCSARSRGPSPTPTWCPVSSRGSWSASPRRGRRQAGPHRSGSSSTSERCRTITAPMAAASSVSSTSRPPPPPSSSSSARGVGRPAAGTGRSPWRGPGPRARRACARPRCLSPSAAAPATARTASRRRRRSFDLLGDLLAGRQLRLERVEVAVDRPAQLAGLLGRLVDGPGRGRIGQALEAADGPLDLGDALADLGLGLADLGLDLCLGATDLLGRGVARVGDAVLGVGLGAHDLGLGRLGGAVHARDGVVRRVGPKGLPGFDPLTAAPAASPCRWSPARPAWSCPACSTGSTASAWRAGAGSTTNSARCR